MKRLLLIPFLFTGCLRVDTNPLPVFEDVQEEVCCRTDHAVAWEIIPPTLSDPLSLEEALCTALLNNRQLHATYHELGIGKGQLAQAGLLRNPLFALSYRFSTNPSITALVDTSLMQNVLELLLIPLKKRAAASALEATKHRVTGEILQLIASTKEAFYTYQAAKETLALKKAAVFGAEAAYEAAQRLLAAGNIRELDLGVTRLTYKRMQTEQTDLELEWKRAREQLNYLMGLCSDEICWETDAPLPSLIEEEWNEVECWALTNSTDLASARSQLLATAAGFGVDTTRTVFPEFSLGAAAEREDGVWFVGPAIALSIPLFDFGRAISATARAEIARQWDLYIAKGIEIQTSARLAQAQLTNRHAQAAQYLYTLVPLAEKQTTLTLEQHNGMQLGVLDLLATKIEELDQKIAATFALRDFWVARAQLELIVSGKCPDSF